MKIYVAVVEDSHIDTLVFPFTTVEAAIDRARTEAEKRAWEPENIHEEPPSENYLFLITYSTEGRCVWVREVDLVGDIGTLPYAGRQHYCDPCMTYHSEPLHHETD